MIHSAPADRAPACRVDETLWITARSRQSWSQGQRGDAFGGSGWASSAVAETPGSGSTGTAGTGLSAGGADTAGAGAAGTVGRGCGSDDSEDIAAIAGTA